MDASPIPGSEVVLSIAPIGHVIEIHGSVVDITCETLPPLNRSLFSHYE